MVLKSLLQRPKPERPQDSNKCSGRVKSRDDSIGCCIDATLRRIASSGYQAAADESMGSVENHQAENHQVDAIRVTLSYAIRRLQRGSRP